MLVSTGYDPQSDDPTTVTWMPISGDFTVDDWSRSTNLAIPLSGDVRLAFHYTTDGTGPGDGSMGEGAETTHVSTLAPIR